MSGTKIVSPDVFFSMFLLCLSWQWNDIKMSKMFTTVDKVVRILVGLGILSQKQADKLFMDQEMQMLFSVKCSRRVPGCFDSNLGTEREQILNSKSLLVVSYPATESFSRRRMLRDYKMFMTQRGKSYAEAIEKKYEDLLCQEEYVSECATQDRQIPQRAIASIMMRYRAKIKFQTG